MARQFYRYGIPTSRRAVQRRWQNAQPAIRAAQRRRRHINRALARLRAYARALGAARVAANRRRTNQRIRRTVSASFGPTMGRYVARRMRR